jgi:hypothetical protein
MGNQQTAPAPKHHTNTAALKHSVSCNANHLHRREQSNTQTGLGETGMKKSGTVTFGTIGESADADSKDALLSVEGDKRMSLVRILWNFIRV